MEVLLERAVHSIIKRGEEEGSFGREEKDFEHLSVVSGAILLDVLDHFFRSMGP